MRRNLYQFGSIVPVNPRPRTIFDRTANQIRFSDRISGPLSIDYSIDSIRCFRARKRWKIYTTYTLIFEKYWRRNTLLKVKLSEDNFVIFLIVQILKGCVLIKF